MTLMRLQKYLSEAGFCSRRKAEIHIQQGRVKVNTAVVTLAGTKIDPATDRVEVDGVPVEPKPAPVYLALNKPEGYVTSCSQPDDKIVLDLIDLPMRIYPVGRLDKDSCGLLLLTNDGSLHHHLSHPSFDHEKEYEVTVQSPVSDGALKKMETGLAMMGTRTRPAEIKRISSRRFYITLKEGRNRQIRRMVRKVGNHVTELKRIRISNIRLGKLPQGAWRYLTEKEKQQLLSFE
ncbi:MAG: pseudouridine synthase [Desulfobacterales bacterium]|nr:pseudouridine synthase [Desulfobacterales bacterium]